MSSAPAGIVEAGAPSFVVLGSEAIGLGSAPTDLHVLPDGRILVVSQQALAFGDGGRWESFRGTNGQGGDPQASVMSAQVAVDRDGRIYTGANGPIARVDLGEDGRWHFTQVATVPADNALPTSALIYVAVFPDNWYWYGGSGAIVSWRPGQKARVIGHVGAVDRIFSLRQQVFVSSQSSGELYRLVGDGSAVRLSSDRNLASDSVTCSAPFGPDRLLVGTPGNGLKIFNGTTFQDFKVSALLGTHYRINDLCATSGGFFAAAVDTLGIIFFDREGHTVQVLDRSLDHRLGRVQRLEYSPTGVLWALLNDGVARVEFPTPVSHFEPLLASGLVYAKPMRYDGQVWIQADGRALRGVYDATGRLERFDEDMPAGRFLFSLTSVDGQLFAANEEGVFLREGSGWKEIAPGIVNARVGVASSPEGLLYIARDEFGWMRRTPGGCTIRRIPAPGLGDNYSATTDAAGVIWMELGTGRVGRFDLAHGAQTIDILGTREGLFDGWVQIFMIDGIARFNLPGHLLRFDDALHRFVEDRDFLTRFPEVQVGTARPAIDAFGRLWFASNGGAHFLRAAPGGGRTSVETVPVGFEPGEFTMEDNGVVWMWGRLRMVRFDPRLPSPPAGAPRTMITSVQFSASNRQLFTPGAVLGSLPYTDNSLLIHFAAPSNPFASPITFEVMLEGSVNRWASTGNVGSAAFSRLKEGNYVFHVRPVAGGVVGAEAQLAFTVQPPWYRTPLAWVLYVLGAVGLVVIAAWLSSFLERRENVHLERVVTERTRELNATNAQLERQIAESTEKSTALAASEERYRALNAELEQRVQTRIAELSQKNAELFQERMMLRTLIDNLPICIYAKDAAGRKTLANPADLKNLRCATEAEALGKTDFDLFPHDVAAKFFADDQAVVQTGRPVLDREEYFFDEAGRKHWLMTSKLPLLNQSGAIVGLIGIGHDITALKETEQKVDALHRQLLQASRSAGMAEVATGVLHNVGNVLNSVNISAGVLAKQLHTSRVDGVAKLARLLREQGVDLARFLTEDERGRKVPAYMDQLAQHLEQERVSMATELDGLILNIDHIKEIVAMQQNYAQVSGVVETVELPELVEDAFKIHGGAYARHGIAVERSYEKVPTMMVDKHTVLQILVNLLHNAKYACDAANRPDKRVIVRIMASGQDRVKVEVADNGVGIAPENLTRIFSQGFTTRKGGHGFGLHSGALGAKQLGGSLSVQSDGLGKGAIFTLELPVQPPQPEQRKPQAETSPAPPDKVPAGPGGGS